mmetsp:Transcript_31329/g.65513  ORF Transcript_31329/g.65513 Transcript_31329/m.65513 type:complete len:1636 (-) Transcript_31329:697-5604(-)
MMVTMKRRESYPRYGCPDNNTLVEAVPLASCHDTPQQAHITPLSGETEEAQQKHIELKMIGRKNPLTWDEARSRLRKTMERWDEERRHRRMSLLGSISNSAALPARPINEENSTFSSSNNARTEISPWKFIPKCIRQVKDPDMVFLAIPLSTIFVTLSFLLPSLDLDTVQYDDKRFNKMQQYAAILFFISSLVSAWITKRRRVVSEETDGSIERRRCVAKFLNSMKLRQDRRYGKYENKTSVGEGRPFRFRPIDSQGEQQSRNGPSSQSTTANNYDSTHHDLFNFDVIPRKNVEDVYSIYRFGLSQSPDVSPPDQQYGHAEANSLETPPHAVSGGDYQSNRIPNRAVTNSNEQGRWHRIPSLLLVQGDFIALKVGDTAPAKCRALHSWEISKNEENASLKDNSEPIPKIIKAGERLTIDSLPYLAKESLMPPSKASANISKAGLLPTGKSTLKTQSEELLLLANGLQIYELLETPLDLFLRRKDDAIHKTPLLIRQGLAVRTIFLYIAITFFTLTLFFLLIRPGGAQYFFHSTTWNLPLLAALSVLPVISPMYIFFLECIGTARILATVHPLTKTRTNGPPPKNGQKNMAETGHNGARGGGIGSVDGGMSTSDESLRLVITGEIGRVEKPPLGLLFRYMMATYSSRLFTKSPTKMMTQWMRQKSGASATADSALLKNVPLQPSDTSWDSLLSIPPASLHLLEKLGGVTALALIDDELASEPFSTPQQLLIPSGQGGLKLLDICPVFDDEDAYSTDDEDNETSNYPSSSRNSITASRFNSRNTSDVYSVDSDEDFNDETRYNHTFSAPARTLRKIRGRYRRRKRGRRALESTGLPRNDICQRCGVEEYGDVEVQFEDPLWWQFLPSLKCIGLGCLLVEEGISSRRKEQPLSVTSKVDPAKSKHKVSFGTGKSRNSSRRISRVLCRAEKTLLDHICHERQRKQLSSLARCIGFDTHANEFGDRGDLSFFHERRRLHVISTDLLRQRMNLESHSLGLEEGRNWSRLSTDATVVFVHDSRSGGDFILTVGDASVVTELLCSELWQGENSTISPLTTSDRQVVNETSKNWMLSDLDVVAFSYAPLPYTADHKIGWGEGQQSQIFLMNNPIENNAPLAAGTGFWSLIKNQIFLGLLGSSVRPRKEIEPLIDACAKAGVRWVYFSPRNMRRTKELASQMGIDTAWNCAISLRPLESGTDDTFRMTSNYADWDVNAKLPHGVEDVKRHLEEVDNVPLLVSLFTDVTKETTAEMVNIFQDYHDTVLSVGLSHLPRNQEIFSRADIAIGVDVLAEEVSFHHSMHYHTDEESFLLPEEILFVSSISAYSSVFNLPGSSSICHLMEIIRIGRASLEAVTAAVAFVLSGNLSFGIFILLCPCTAATAVPVIPTLGSFLYMLVLLMIGSSIAATTDEDSGAMSRVPPKNDPSSKFSLKESKRIYMNGVLRAAPQAILSQFVYIVAFCQLMWEFESPFLEEHCLDFSGNESMGNNPPMVKIIRCDALRNYSGPAKISAGMISLASLAICTCFSSASFVFRTESIRSEPPWKRNHLWVLALFLSLISIAVYLGVSVEKGSMVALPLNFYALFLASPFLCLFLNELVKKIDHKHEKRAVMMRRLQFETRLGMWSPKESSHIMEHVANKSPIL